MFVIAFVMFFLVNFLAVLIYGKIWWHPINPRIHSQSYRYPNINQH